MEAEEEVIMVVVAPHGEVEVVVLATHCIQSHTLRPVGTMAMGSPR